ncbi:hormogonium polysaccharide secretion pseudopilin HpsC [Nodularia spumigena]|jgi:type II secretory pathway pseudopilin PulG
MMKTFQFIVRSQFKSSKVTQNPGGFTLIELLVAGLISVLIITPLLGFMISVMTTDRKEQAKANSEQEIQTAVNYIARDLQQAVYIYDNAGVTAIKDELPDGTGQSPLLVFWKRELVPNVVPAADNTKDDAFVYSLIAYYLIKDTNSTWSKAARIARWQIKDGVSVNGQYISPPDQGFAPFADKVNNADSLEDGMNQWTQATPASNAPVTPLIDYVDQSTNSVPPATCPTTTATNTWSTITPANGMTGFYVCVDRENITAQVFIRGNALARLENDANKIKYSVANSTYFPTTNVMVQGKGFLFK